MQIFGLKICIFFNRMIWFGLPRVILNFCCSTGGGVKELVVNTTKVAAFIKREFQPVG